MCCLSYDIYRWLNILVSSDKDEKPKALSRACPLRCTAGDFEQPTHFSVMWSDLLSKNHKLGAPAKFPFKML